MTIPFWGWIYSSVFNDATYDHSLNKGLIPSTKYELKKDVFIYSYREPASLRVQDNKISISEWSENGGMGDNDDYQFITGILQKGTVLSYLSAKKEHHWNGGMSILFYGSTSIGGKETVFIINEIVDDIESGDSNEFLQKI